MKLETLDSTSLERIPKISEVHRGGLKSNRSKNSPKMPRNTKHRISGRSLESRNSPLNPKNSSSYNRSIDSSQNLIPSRANRNKTPIQQHPRNPEDKKTAIKQPGVGQYKNSRDSLTPKRSRVPALRLDIKNINQEPLDSDRLVKNTYGYYETGNFGRVGDQQTSQSYSSGSSDVVGRVVKKNLKKSEKEKRGKYGGKYQGSRRRLSVQSGSDENGNSKTEYDYSEGSKGRVSKESLDGSYEAEFQYLSKQKPQKQKPQKEKPQKEKPQKEKPQKEKKTKVAFVYDDCDRPSGKKGSNFDYGDLGHVPGRGGREQPKGGYHAMRSKIKDISESLTELRISRSKRREGSVQEPPVEGQNPFVAKNTLKRDNCPAPQPKIISENKKSSRGHYYDKDRECMKIDGDCDDGNTPKDANSKYRLHREKHKMKNQTKGNRSERDLPQKFSSGDDAQSDELYNTVKSKRKRTNQNNLDTEESLQNPNSGHQQSMPGYHEGSMQQYPNSQMGYQHHPGQQGFPMYQQQQMPPQGYVQYGPNGQQFFVPGQCPPQNQYFQQQPMGMIGQNGYMGMPGYGGQQGYMGQWNGGNSQVFGQSMPMGQNYPDNGFKGSFAASNGENAFQGYRERDLKEEVANLAFENELLRKREYNDKRRNNLSKKFNDEFTAINEGIISKLDRSETKPNPKDSPDKPPAPSEPTQPLHRNQDNAAKPKRSHDVNLLEDSRRNSKRAALAKAAPQNQPSIHNSPKDKLESGSDNKTSKIPPTAYYTATGESWATQDFDENVNDTPQKLRKQQAVVLNIDFSDKKGFPANKPGWARQQKYFIGGLKLAVANPGENLRRMRGSIWPGPVGRVTIVLAGAWRRLF